MNLSTETTPSLQVLRIIHLAMGVGVLFFMMVVLFYAATLNESDANLQEVGHDRNDHSLSYLSLFITVMIPFGAQRLFDSMIRKNLLGLTAPSLNPYSVFLQPHIFRLALIEAMVLFALVVFLIQILQTGKFAFTFSTGVTLFSLLTFGIFWIRWFPTEEKVYSAVNKSFSSFPA